MKLIFQLQTDENRSGSSGKYLRSSSKSQDQSGTWLMSISAIVILQLCQDRHPWNIHPPPPFFSSLATLSCCKTTMGSPTHLKWYLHQSSKSRDQSGTWKMSISAIHILQLGRDRHPWNIHPPSFSGFVTLSFCNTTMGSPRHSKRYLHQSSKSQDQSGTWLMSISAIQLSYSWVETVTRGIFIPFPFRVLRL